MSKAAIKDLKEAVKLGNRAASLVLRADEKLESPVAARKVESALNKFTDGLRSLMDAMDEEKWVDY